MFPQHGRLPHTYENRVLLLHTTQVGRQLWDLSIVLSNPCFRGWHNEHKHQADTNRGK